MKVSEIRIDRTRSLGNYENIKLGLSVVPEDNEDLIETVEKLKLILDWELNKEDRERQYTRLKAQLESGDLKSNIETITRWINQYETQRDAINALRR